MPTHPFHFLTVALLFAGLALTGCGRSGSEHRAAVRGKVATDGKPVESGSISFVPVAKDGGPSAGGTIVDGNYVIERDDGPYVGKQQVKIYAMRKTGRKVESGDPAPPGTLVDEMAQVLPAKYNEKTELDAEIQPGENEIDFNLPLGK